MKRIFITFLSLILVFGAGVVLAEVGAETQMVRNDFSPGKFQGNELSKEARKNLRNSWREQRQQVLEQMKQERLNIREQHREKIAGEKCARIQNRIQNRLSLNGSAKTKHMSVYVNLVNRVQKFINRFEAFYNEYKDKADASLINQLNEDIQKLKNDFGTASDPSTAETLQGKIAAFKASYDEYASKLKSLKTGNCGTEGDFKSSLAEVKVYLKTVHSNAAAIRQYVRTVILPDLLAVKKDIAQIREAVGAENDEEDSDENANTPSVRITSPADGSNYTSAQTVSIAAQATSKKGIMKVEFYDGQDLKGTDTTAPYTYDWSITAGENGTHVWTAKAYNQDKPALTAVSEPVSIVVDIK